MEDLELYLPPKQTSDEPISSFTEVIGDVPTPWEEGDVITFPATIKGYSFKTKIGNKKYEYIVVKVKSVDGSERKADFFPSLFRKRARVCNWDTVDGVDIAIPTNDFVFAGGSIVEQLYTKKSKVNDVVLAVLGQSIKISEVHEVQSMEFGSTNPKLAKVYDFEPYRLHKGHEWVDLELPSGLKWATCYVGASSPEDFGDWFSWGETETKEKYEYNNSLTHGLSKLDLESQGYIDSEGNLTPLHDAATANWGGNWRMPTEEEIEELTKECIWKWTTKNGVTGYKVIGPNGNSIFLPGEELGDGELVARCIGFWSSTLYNYNNIKNLAYELCYSFGGVHHVDVHYCYYCSLVRPVLK